MLAILDYKAGNQTSVRRALDSLGVECAITDDPKVVEAADGIIFPGVGAAGQAMKELKSRGLDEVLKAMVWAEKPVLGICIGCQVLLDYTQENDTVTLGLIPGECVLFTPGLTDDDGQPVKVPHMGWNRVKLVKDCALFKDVDPASEFYFVHSFHPKPAPEFVVGVTSYGEEFCSVHGREGLWATQFHPEKSGRPGLKILQNFHDYCMERRRAV